MLSDFFFCADSINTAVTGSAKYNNHAVSLGRLSTHIQRQATTKEDIRDAERLSYSSVDDCC